LKALVAARIARFQRVAQGSELGLALLEQPEAGAYHLARRSAAAEGAAGPNEAEKSGGRG
jgi:hypothetical protein